MDGERVLAEAGEAYLEHGQAPGAELVAAAVGWRTAPPHDQVLAAGLLRDHLVPLYLYYIDDHIKRLVPIGESRLAAGFREWRARLTQPPGGAVRNTTYGPGRRAGSHRTQPQ